MKGGVTSGLVYPPALLLLQQRYRFRCIGGTSAGAIAAALAAAAEFGRESGGFDRLAEVLERLEGARFIRNLFQPADALRPFFLTLLTSARGWATPWIDRHIGRGWIAWPLRVLWRGVVLTACATWFNPWSFIRGALIGVVVAALFVWRPLLALLRGAHPGLVIDLPGALNLTARADAGAIATFGAWLAFGTLLGGLVGLIIALASVVWNLPRNDFGLCSGARTPKVPRGVEVLTDWLGRTLNELAGLPAGSAPLTFGQLESKRLADADVGVTLRMITSDLSQMQPFVLPFSDHPLLARRDAMARFFGPQVVEAMLRHPEEHPDIVPPAGWAMLRTGPDMPVIVATRLSLSFPFLLCAVPLDSIRPAAGRRRHAQLVPGDLQRHWFSDGGISSNFPIHMFDAWLPTRPTFGINLTEVPARREGERGSAARPEPSAAAWDASRKPPPVHLPKADRPFQPAWFEISSTWEFVRQIFSTAQNHHDTMQMMLPSYRDRVAQVELESFEGGLNLDMSAAAIHSIVDKGARAGHLLLEEFRPDEHYWVRLRVLMNSLEEELIAWQRTVGIPDEGLDPDYFKLLARGAAGEFSYPLHADELADAHERLRVLSAAVHEWHAHRRFGARPPLPEPAFRATPPTGSAGPTEHGGGGSS